jgi:phosphoribosylformylglycinamidine (FGAM) synthase PurS component
MEFEVADTEEMVKVRFRGPHPSDVETLWAKPVNVNQYQLDNSPFYAYGVSWQDVIEATRGADDFLEYVRCVRKSGNRTLRVIFQDGINDPQSQNVLQGLRRMGVSYEGMQPKMISINVPPRKDLDEITEFLSEKSGLQWEYADPTYDEVTGGRNS